MLVKMIGDYQDYKAGDVVDYTDVGQARDLCSKGVCEALTKSEIEEVKQLEESGVETEENTIENDSTSEEAEEPTEENTEEPKPERVIKKRWRAQKGKK